MKEETPTLTTAEQIAVIRKILGPNLERFTEDEQDEADYYFDEPIEPDLCFLIKGNY